MEVGYAIPVLTMELQDQVFEPTPELSPFSRPPSRVSTSAKPASKLSPTSAPVAGLCLCHNHLLETLHLPIHFLYLHLYLMELIVGLHQAIADQVRIHQLK